MGEMRCPHCGSPVMVRGRQWECGWCGDSGFLARPPEPREAPDSGLHFTLELRWQEPEEEKPDLAVLEDAVARWDFSRYRDGLRDFLLAVFPELGARRSGEELRAMDAEDLLNPLWKESPALALAVWRRVLDTAEARLQDPATAEYLLRDLPGNAPGEGEARELVLRALEQDARFARQLFSSAWAGCLQEELLRAGAPALREALTVLLERNPYYKRFP